MKKNLTKATATTVETPTAIAPETTPTAVAPVTPKDLAEAQDMAEAKGIDYVGKNLAQLTAELNGTVIGQEKDKTKAIKVKKEIEVPANVDPAIKAAIDKANAEIAIAKAKVQEAKEAAKKEKDEKKAAADKEKADRVAKIQAEKAEKEATAKKEAEEFEAKKAEREKALAAAEELLGVVTISFNEAKAKMDEATAAVSELKKLLGQKVPSVKKAGTGGGGARVVDMTKYVVGQEYPEVNNKGNIVAATCKGVVGSAGRGKFYKFKETLSGNIFHIRAHAED